MVDGLSHSVYVFVESICFVGLGLIEGLRCERNGFMNPTVYSRKIDVHQW